MTQEARRFTENEPHADSEQLAEEAASWFIRMRAEQVAEPERQRFQGWLALSETHQREYASFEKLWGALDGLSRPPPRKKRRVASVAALVSLLSIAFIYTNAAVNVEKSTKIGVAEQLVLADGSVIEVDADTVLQVDYSLWRRQITLERGQALFKVAPGWRPFEVKVGEGRLRDIGTTFNVLEDHGKVTVAVSEGAVEISLDASPKRYLLTGGNLASFAAGEISAARKITPQAAEAWLNNRWYFEDASLGEVVSQINRQHERPIRLADTSLERYRVSGVFDRTDRAGLLKALGVILPIKAEETASGTLLHQR